MDSLKLWSINIRSDNKTKRSLIRIIKREGSLSGAARALGTSHKTVSRWVNGWNPISPVYVRLIAMSDVNNP